MMHKRRYYNTVYLIPKAHKLRPKFMFNRHDMHFMSSRSLSVCVCQILKYMIIM